jgi:hypothetical protein
MLGALMTRFWEELLDGTGRFRIGFDKRGDLPGLSSDGLHLLWSLPTFAHLSEWAFVTLGCHMDTGFLK